jgi:hypothetical protein
MEFAVVAGWYWQDYHRRGKIGELEQGADREGRAQELATIDVAMELQVAAAKELEPSWVAAEEDGLE